MEKDKGTVDALKEISDFLDRPKLVSVGGQDYALAKLRPVDLADARDWVVNKRSARFMLANRHVPLDSDTRAKTLAAIECAPLSIYDVIQDPHGRLRMIFLSVTRLAATDRKQPLTMKELEAQLDPTTQDELYAFVMWISGCLPEPVSDQEADDDAPLSSQADTTASPP
ncbi:MAG: hypothetical protein O7D91_17805 [Planctomycetota bacterium]|nr:hypothetical protein [Planctomycetota bacterium]